MRALPRKLLWPMTGIYVVALAAASLLPDATGMGRLDQWAWDARIDPKLQNALHVPAYTVLDVLVCLSAGTVLRAGWFRLAALGMVCLGYGTVLELAQAWIPGRIGSAADALLNAVGVAAGLGACLLVQRAARWRDAKAGTPSGRHRETEAVR